MAELIFICTVGGSPAVATETLWSLIKDSSPARLPVRIEIITTMDSLRRVSQTLQSPVGIMASLFPAGIPPVVIYVPRKDGDRELEPLAVAWPGGSAPAPSANQFIDPLGLTDIISETDARIMGDLIKDRVWAAADPARKGPETEIHISIAGGRKTMSAHALLSLALVGRIQDEASHVLVSPEFENHPGFWHKAQGGLLNTRAELLALRDKQIPLPPPILDPATAEITLIRTPTPLVSELDAKRANLGKLKLSEIMRQIDIANSFRRAPRLELDSGSNTVTLGGIAKKFNPVPFAQMRLLAVACTWKPERADEHPLGRITASWLRDGGARPFDPVRKFIKILEEAWKVDGRIPLEDLRAKAEKGVMQKNGPLYLTVELHQKMNRLREPDIVIEREIVKDVQGWLGSGTELAATLEAAFGQPVTALLLKKLSGKKGDNWAIWLNCPAEAIAIR
ncbi:MAG: CRISPR-associated ring nuclease Csm6 [Pseudomonadota bacterium]